MCLVYHNISIESRKIRVEWLRLSFGKKNFFCYKEIRIYEKFILAGKKLYNN
jgi:hypothetical protein